MMKKRLFNVVTMLLVVGALVSCSDEDPKYYRTPLQGEYTVGSNLVLKVNGIEIDYTGTLYVNGDVGAVRMAIPGMSAFIAGEDEILFDPLLVAEESGVESLSMQPGNYVLSGSVSEGTRTIGLKGDVTKDGKMTLDLTVKETAAVVGKWKLQTPPAAPLSVAFNNKAGLTTVDMAGMTLTNEQFISMIAGMGNMLRGYLAEIELRSDGQLTAGYYADGQGGAGAAATISPAYYLSYNVKNGRIDMVPNIAAMTKAMPDFTPVVMMNYTLTDNGAKMNVYLTKDSFTPYMSVFPGLVGLIPAEMTLPYNGQEIKVSDMANSLLVIIKDCQQFYLGLNLQKVQ